MHGLLAIEAFAPPQVGAALGSMNLDRPELDNGVWPSTVSIQEHELGQPAAPMPTAAMPSIPSAGATRQLPPRIGLPRADSGGGAGSSNVSAPPPSAPLPPSTLTDVRVSEPLSSEPATMGSLLSMDLGDLDAGIGGMDDLTAGDIFGGSQSPLPSHNAASPAANYNIVSVLTLVLL